MAKKKAKPPAKAPQSEHAESKRLVECAFDLARSLEITKMLVQADELRDVRFVEKLRESELDRLADSVRPRAPAVESPQE